MNVTATSSQSGSYPLTNGPANSHALELSSNRSLHASMRAATEISIMTDEGDRVTLSSAVARSLQIDDSVALKAGENGLKASFSHSEASKESADFSMSVEGDLNAEERKDIRRLMRSLSRIVSKFFQGDTDGAIKGAVKAAGKLGKLDSLSGFDLAASIEMRITERQTSSASVGMPQIDAPEPAPVATTQPANPLSQAISQQPAPTQVATAPSIEPVAVTPATAQVAAPADTAESTAGPAVTSPTAVIADAGQDADEQSAAADAPAMDAAVIDLRDLLARPEYSGGQVRDLIPAMILDVIDQFRESADAEDDGAARLDRLEQRLLDTVRDNASTSLVYESHFSREVTESYSMSVSVFA